MSIKSNTDNCKVASHIFQDTWMQASFHLAAMQGCMKPELSNSSLHRDHVGMSEKRWACLQGGQIVPRVITNYSQDQRSFVCDAENSMWHRVSALKKLISLVKWQFIITKLFLCGFRWLHTLPLLQESAVSLIIFRFIFFFSWSLECLKVMKIRGKI